MTVKSWEVNIYWKKPKATKVIVEAESQAAAMAMIESEPGKFLTTLSPNVDADRVDVRESKTAKPAAAAAAAPKTTKADPSVT